MPKEKKIYTYDRTAISITPAIHMKFKEIAIAEGMKLYGLIDKALQEWLDRNKK